MAGWGITSESQARAQAVYDKENTVRVSLKLNIRTDDDITVAPGAEIYAGQHQKAGQERNRRS